MAVNIEDMWFRTGREQIKPATYTRYSSAFIDRDFQVRYTILLLASSMVGLILVVGPLFYFINQNYQIFMDLAYDRAPTLIRYLEMERRWIFTLLASVTLGLLCFFSYLGIKMTAKIVGPLNVLKNHIRLLSRGHWYIAPVRTRDSDEFHDLVESYNYFFRSFQANLRNDLERLGRLNIDPQQREAYSTWLDLIEEKRSQLKMQEPEYFNLDLAHDAPGSEVHGPRNAS